MTAMARTRQGRGAGRGRARVAVTTTAAAAVVVGTFGLAPAAVAAPTVTDVRGGQILTWDSVAAPGAMPPSAWFRDLGASSGAGAAAVTQDLDEPQAQDGSLRLSTPGASDAVVVAHAAPSGASLAATGALGYATRVATGSAGAVYRLSVDCNGTAVAGGRTVLTTLAPAQTASAGWATIDASAAQWWSSMTINSDGTTVPSSEVPDAGGLRGGPVNPAPLSTFTGVCPGVVLSYGVGLGAGTAGAVVAVDAVTFGDAVTNFQFIPVERLAGSDRIATAVAASQAIFGDASGTEGASAVVLASSAVFADGVSGGPLATAVDGPLLLTRPTSLDLRTQTELRRVLGTGGTVYLLGGTGALAPAVQTAVQKLGYTVRRIAGTDRFGTAVAVANAIGTASTVMLTTGLDYPDALSAGAAAAHVGGVVLLTRGTVMPAATRQYLNEHLGTEVYGIGGAAVKAVNSLPRSHQIVGADRYETATKTATVFFDQADMVAFASGENFPDALSGGAFAGLIDAPVLLVRKSVTPTVVSAWLAARYANLSAAALFGGSGAISDPVRDQLQRVINGGS